MDFKYPYTDFHELNLDWFLAEFKKLTESWLQVQQDWEDEQQAYQDLHDYVENYFANLDLYQEVHDILWSPEMQGNIQIILSNLTSSLLPSVVADQITAVVATQLSTVVALQLPAVVEAKLPAALPAAVAGEASAWLADHVDPATGYVIDDTLSIALAAADAKATGVAVSSAQSDADINLKILSELEINGKTTVDVSDAYLTPGGSYNGSHVWTANANVAATKFDIRIPEGCSVEVSCTDGSVNIQEFIAATGTRTKNITGTTVPGILPSTSANCIYSFVANATALANSYTFTITGPSKSEIQILKRDTAILARKIVDLVGDILTKGTGHINEPLEVGYFGVTGLWTTTNNTQASVPVLYRVPSDCVIEFSTTLTDTTTYIKEFTYDGVSYTRTANESGGATTTFTDTKSDRYYSFALFDANGYVTAPTTGYTIKVTSPYYDLKGAGSSNEPEISYTYDQATEKLILICDKAKYIIQRQIKPSINLDAWRLYAGYIYVNGDWREMWNNTDAEGVIKIDNEADFIGGYHGDEIYDPAETKIYIDNAVLDLTLNSSGLCKSVMLYQKSTVYRCNSSTEAFTRYKRVRIIGNDFNVQQRWISKITCSITRGPLCLMQCPKTYIVGWDTDQFLPISSANIPNDINLDKDTKIGNIYLKDNKMISIIAEVGYDNAYYTPWLTDFNGTGRIKYYFDMYNGRTLAIDDEIHSKFSFKVNELQ